MQDSKKSLDCTGPFLQRFNCYVLLPFEVIHLEMPWAMPSRHKYKQTNCQGMRKHLVWMPVLQCCCAVLLLMWDPSPACFLIFTSWSHSVNWEEQLITCYAATDSTD